MTAFWGGVTLATLGIIGSFIGLVAWEVHAVQTRRIYDTSDLDRWALRLFLGFTMGLALIIGALVLFLPTLRESAFNPWWLPLGSLAGVTLACLNLALYLRVRATRRG